jgi:mannose-6-phosphate isomerase-like protein (cupin superfamily)
MPIRAFDTLKHMKHVSKYQTRKYENSSTCTAFEYETANRNINIARIEITGRYPENGSAINTVATEVVYVEEGAGIVSVNGEQVELRKGDVIHIEKNEQVYWEGTLTLIIACTPAWYPEQYKIASN